MRNTKNSLIAVLLAFSCIGLQADKLLAQNYAAPLIRVSPYARQVAMAEAFTALANDINVMRYNAGGLGGLEHILLSTHFHQWIDDTYQGSLEFGLPAQKIGLPAAYGTVGLTFAYFDEGELVEITEQFTETGNIFESHDFLLSFGYGNRFRLFNQDLQIGASLGYLYQKLVGNSGYGLGVDAGLIYTIQNIFSVGAALQNYTLRELELSDGSAFKLPETVRLGLGAKIPLAPNFSWRAGVDASRFLDAEDEDIRYALGSEVIIGRLSLRGGYKFHDEDVSRWGAGFGVNIPMAWFGGSSTTFDYAYSPLDNFDSQAHRFSVSFNFGKEEPFDPSTFVVPTMPDDARLRIQELEGRLGDLESRLTNIEAIAQGDTFITIVRKAEGVLVTLRVNFDFDKSNIRPDMYNTLDNVANILRTFDDREIFISGHTDSIGTDEYNVKLAQRRMRSVVRYLDRNGIDSTRYFNPVPYGEWKPFTSNSTPENRFLNRRVEFFIYTTDKKPQIPEGSIVRDVYVRNDTIVVEANGRMINYSTRLIDGPPRTLIILSKFYLPDPITRAINLGNVIQARLGYHPEDGSTWIVLDMENQILPEVISRKNQLLIIPQSGGSDF